MDHAEVNIKVKPTFAYAHPGFLGRGWVPLAILLLFIIGFYELLKAVGSTTCEARQSVFTLLLASFVTLTFVGIFLRGEGMILLLPWS